VSLSEGQHLLHYRVVEKIGEGGMGAVWKALDTVLDREVAIKVLPAAFALDADRLARFEREAKLLASLNHPNIAAVYGLHDHEGIRFLAMERVRGEDLQRRLARGPLALDEALGVGLQVARALEAAHAQGIVHRDLKPANIVRDDDGVVKVLDFGLAKALAGDPASGDANPSLSPTLTSAGTRAGMILGTAAYMAPEQARGRPTDGRADVWAFGAVLMEAITGRQVFAGETVSDILASVLKSAPDSSLLPPSTPVPVRRLLRRCLRKDRDARLHHPADARIEIEAAREPPDPIEVAGAAGADRAGAAPVPAWKRILPWVVAGAALIAAVAMAVRTADAPQVADPISYRFDLAWDDDSDMPEIAPDGSRYAFLHDEGGDRQIRVRSFSDREARTVVTVDAAARGLTWSPDGGQLAYFVRGSLETVRVDTGTTTPWCTGPDGWLGGTWSGAGPFLMEVTANPESNGWYLCRPGRTTAEPVNRPLPLENGQIKAWPEFLPDGEHYVYVQHVGGTRQAVLGRLDSDQTTPMFPTDTRVRVAADGRYLYAVKGQLLAQPFDRSTFLPAGDRVKLADRVDMFEPNGWARFSVSDRGAVLYRTGEHIDELAWFDRGGNPLGAALAPGEYAEWDLSPDGGSLALVIRDPQTGTGDLWVHDLDRGSTDRVTGTSWSEFAPRWSPDGTEIVYSADPDGPPNVFVVGVDGGEPRVLVPFNSMVHYPSDWSSDGATIVFQRYDPATRSDVWRIDATGGEPEAVVATEHAEFSARISPDGRWLAFVSDETGRNEVYVQPFGRAGAKQRVSVESGSSPAWDGNDRLVYRSDDDRLLAVALRPSGARLAIGKPELLADFAGRSIGRFALHPDGRILATSHANHGGTGDVVKVIVGSD